MSEMKITIGNLSLYGILSLPKNAIDLVIFAHGSGSGRHSPRNQMVAGYLNTQNIGTLLFDLLTEKEEQIDEKTSQLRFDIPFLAKRLIAVTDWVMAKYPMAIGYFGASTGAAAALVAAAERPMIKAIVSRGGRPDLAKEALKRIKAPTLLIVGGLDAGVIELNEAALQGLQCEKKLEIVP